MGKNRNNNFIDEAPVVTEEVSIETPVVEEPAVEPAPVVVEEIKPEPEPQPAPVIKEEPKVEVKKVEAPKTVPTKPGIKEEKAKKTATL